MSQEFRKEELLRGLDILGETEIVAPCTHQYKTLLPLIAVERASIENGSDTIDDEAYIDFQRKHSTVFKEIATCHGCTETYLLAVIEATK